MSSWRHRTSQNAIIVDRVVSAVTVTDPQHSLFGQRLALANERSGRGPAYVVVRLPDPAHDVAIGWRRRRPRSWLRSAAAAADRAAAAAKAVDHLKNNFPKNNDRGPFQRSATIYRRARLRLARAGKRSERAAAAQPMDKVRPENQSEHTPVSLRAMSRARASRRDPVVPRPKPPAHFAKNNKSRPASARYDSPHRRQWISPARKSERAHAGVSLRALSQARARRRDPVV